MTKRYWTSATAPASAAPTATVDAVRGDEFAPDVALAIAELRARHDLDSTSCQSAGNSAEELDRLRRTLSDLIPGINRRSFLRLTGAAAVFSLAACGPKHPDMVVPWSQQPEGSILGTPQYYSSVLRDGGLPTSVMVKTYDGRPIKLEGNPDDLHCDGRLDARGQAAILNLYDPDRLQDGPHQGDGHALSKISWQDLDTAIGEALKAGPIGLVTGPIDSPAQKQLLQALAQGFGDRFQHAVLEAYPRHAEARARSQLFGNATLPVYRVDRAAVLVSFGDFLGAPQQSMRELVDFGNFRRLRVGTSGSELGQVIVFEPTLSQLGTCSDLRVRVAPNQLATAAWAIAQGVAQSLGVAFPAAASAGSASQRDSLATSLRAVPGTDNLSPIDFAVGKLLAARSSGAHSLVWAGGSNLQGDDALALQLAVAYLNSILGNEGVSVVTPAPEHAPLVDDGSAATVIDKAGSGDIATLIVWGVNPAYLMPASVASLSKAKTLVVLSDRPDETAVLAHYVVPILHGLESWGDAELSPGYYAVQQPVIAPLWDARAAEESLMAWATAAGLSTFTADKIPADATYVSVVTRRALWQAAANGVITWQQYVKGLWTTTQYTNSGSAADPATFWNAALAKGILNIPVNAVAIQPAAGTLELPAAPAEAGGSMQLVITASRTMRDGECLNNAWLQELPDPVSKICWDNYLAVSPVDAARLGIATNTMVKLTVGTTVLSIPAHVQEGQHPGTLELFAGWGRTHAGAVALLSAENGGVSINAFTLSALPLPLALSASVSATGEAYVLASPQSHDFMEGRPVALDEVVGLRGRKSKESGPTWVAGIDGAAGGGVSALRTHHIYPGHKWGMTIDLNTCIGCNACTVACTAENNVPVVGRDEVRKNRVMHWIRIHRYYSGSFDKTGDAMAVVSEKSPESLLDVEVVHQPMLCQHCDNAPCEAVCPANATMHNNEGVNLQIYNRCVGTRYCSNNCPYKARRFNWYQYSAYRAGPINSGNPMARIAHNLRTSGATSAPIELSLAPLQMQLNPEVTVRWRGVMEKCNFCIQRTRTIHDKEHADNRRLPDNVITTACAQTCPTKSIVFGDVNDPESEVVRTAQATGSSYRLLDEALNTKPAISYLKRVRNRPATAEEEGEFEAPSAGAMPAAVPGSHGQGGAG